MNIRGAKYERQPRDYYATPPEPVKALFSVMEFNRIVYDPCCGGGNMLRVFQELGYQARGFDIAPWGDYPTIDFLAEPFPHVGWNERPDIVTNPPWGVQGRLALRFIARALEITNSWHGKVGMLLPVDFDSGKTRQHVFKGCRAFKHKVVLLDRIKWFNNQTGSLVNAWFVWDWTNRDEPTIKYV